MKSKFYIRDCHWFILNSTHIMHLSIEIPKQRSRRYKEKKMTAEFVLSVVEETIRQLDHIDESTYGCK